MARIPRPIDPLVDTRFEGMAPGCFCTYCLFAITQFPDRFPAAELTQPDHVRFDWIGAVGERTHTVRCKTCGWEHSENIVTHTFGEHVARGERPPVRYQWTVLLNRAKLGHLIASRHGGRPELDELRRLFYFDESRDQTRAVA